VGWRAHPALEVWVGLRGEEEFHDAGVTVARGHDERRGPILKERTERERERERERRDHEKGERQQQHTHTTRVRGERKRQEAR
jgi:hypothetical protein